MLGLDAILANCIGQVMVANVNMFPPLAIGRFGGDSYSAMILNVETCEV